MAGGRPHGGRVSPELAAVGERLRAAREASGRSLGDIEAVTRIRVAYLGAIDGGRRGELPGDVFVKGFLRAYANAVGLDGDQVVAQYKRSLAATGAPAPTVEAVAAAPADPPRPAERARRVPTEPRRGVRASGRRPARAPLGREEAVRAARARIRARRHAVPTVRRDRLRWVVGGLVVVAAGLASYALAGHPHRHPAPANKAAAAARSRTHSSAASPPAGKHPLAAHPAGASTAVRPAVRVRFVHLASGWHGTYLVSPATAGLVVRLATDQPCWTERWVDGSTRAQMVTLLAGGTATWKAGRTLRVEVGNAPGVRSLTVDGLSTPALPKEYRHAEWLTFQSAAARSG